MDNRYNGWSNYETWLMNLWYGDYFNDLAIDGEEITADYIKDTVLDIMRNDGLPEEGFAGDIINAALNRVDWDELAEHYNDADISPEGLVNDE